MSSKHQKILEDIFAVPVKSSIPWKSIEQMLIALGAEMSEGSGSRIRIALNGVRAVFHRPHPRKEIDRGAVVSMKRFLVAAGISPKGERL